MNWLCLAASPGHSAVEELEDQEELSSRLLWTCQHDNDTLIDVIDLWENEQGQNDVL